MAWYDYVTGMFQSDEPGSGLKLGTGEGMSIDGSGMGQYQFSAPTDGGLRMTSRPEEGLYVPPSDLKAQSMVQLARGGTQLPEQLGSNDPSTSRRVPFNPMLAQTAMALLSRGGREGPTPQPSLEPAWGASYTPRPFYEAGPNEKASPYRQLQTFGGRQLREQMVQKQRYQRGLLNFDE